MLEKRWGHREHLEAVALDLLFLVDVFVSGSLVFIFLIVLSVLSVLLNHFWIVHGDIRLLELLCHYINVRCDLFVLEVVSKGLEQLYVASHCQFLLRVRPKEHRYQLEG